MGSLGYDAPVEIGIQDLLSDDLTIHKYASPRRVKPVAVRVQEKK